jgi:LacI family transcriptional regulator
MERKPRVAILIPNFFSVTRSVLGGIGQYLRQTHAWVLANNLFGVVERGFRIPRGQVDGVITCFPDSIEKFRGRSIPVVLVTERFLEAPWPRVISDSQAIGRAGALHLLGNAHGDLAFAGEYQRRFAWGRGIGFLRAVQEAGGRCHVLGGLDALLERKKVLIHGPAVRRWLAQLPKPVGLMACNDRLAMDLLNHCQALGLAVPGEVALVGADNDELICDFCAPPLTSVDLNAREAGFQAASLLGDLLAGRPGPSGPVVIPPQGVVIRASSDAFAAGDPAVSAAIKFLRERACGGLKVRDVIAAQPIPRRTFEKVCQKLLGRSPFSEIRRIQLERARQLLMDTDLPLFQVARAAGLGSGKRLSETFRKKWGQTPLSFRRKNRRGPPYPAP